MNIAPLAVDLVRQDAGSDDCLRASALMVFRYFGDSIKKTELWTRIHAYKKHSGLSGSYLTDLGIFALKRGYKVEISHFDFSWWDNKTAEADSRSAVALIKQLGRLKDEKDKWPDKKVVDKEIRYVKRGGVLKVDQPNHELIASYLYNKIPVISLVSASQLYQNPKQDYPHAIVVVGMDDKFIHIRDPLLAYEKVPLSEFTNAWIKNGGWMIAISPSPEKTKQAQIKMFK